MGGAIVIERIEAVPELATTPRHVAVIMDGNRRWAAANGLPQIEGHRRGMLTLRRIVIAAAKLGIEVLTVYAFSEENWGRSSAEVGTLMDLGVTFARREADAFAREGVRVRVIGRRDRLPIALREALTMIETRTAGGSTMTLNLAVDYGARTELATAVRTLAHDVAAGRMAPDDIDEDAIAGRLSTAGMPDPDL